jgi:hypothetical protein
VLQLVGCGCATLLPDLLESLIMVIGSEYSCDALATAVTEMEVDDIVVQTPDCLILLPNKHMVFERLEVKGVVASSAAESLLHVRSLVSVSCRDLTCPPCRVNA